MTYKTSLDGQAKGITIFVTIVFAAIIIGQYSLINDTPIYTTSGLLIFYFVAFAFRPVNYRLTDNSIVVHRLIGNVKIQREKVEGVELIDGQKVKWFFRLYGVGGLFGYFGKFMNTKLGTVIRYATRRDRNVLLTITNGKKIILTPDNPEKFIADLAHP